MHNQFINFGARDLENHHKEFTLTNANKSKLNDMLGIISGRIDITKKSTHDDFEFEEQPTGTYFYPVKAYITIRNLKKQGKKKRINKKIVKYNKNNEVDDVVELDLDLVMNEMLGGSFWPYINKSGIDLSKYQIFDGFDKKNYVDNCHHSTKRASCPTGI